VYKALRHLLSLKSINFKQDANLSENHAFTVFENKALRLIYEPKRDEVIQHRFSTCKSLVMGHELLNQSSEPDGLNLVLIRCWYYLGHKTNVIYNSGS
jgi:hypothetical protein